MTTSSGTAEPILARRVLFAANLVAAIIGGLWLSLAVTAPFNMGMSMGGSFAAVIVVASVCGGIPLLCVASIVWSRWLFGRGTRRLAIAVAGVPACLLLALLVFAFAVDAVSAACSVAAAAITV